MKKFLATILLFSVASAQPLMPANDDFGNHSNMGFAPIEENFSVVNISRKNADGTKVEARPGDTLRYELKIKSNSMDVKNYMAKIDISDIKKHADIINVGLGKIQGNNVVFPPFSQKAPCQKVFSIIVRVKPGCGDNTDNTLTGKSIGKTLSTKLNCNGAATPLPETGNAIWWSVVVGCMLVTLMGMAIRRRTA